MRTVFICVSGISPAIITETLQAMANQGIRADEMHVVTTAIGKADLLRRLRGPREPFARLCQQKDLEPGLLRDDHIHVVAGSDGAELSDIISQVDAAALAKTIGELVRRFTADQDTRIYASLAGGRKTMSFWIGCAMTLFGRPQDRLMHVLVNEPFELCADFLFKPDEPEDVTVTGRDPKGKWQQGVTISTAAAEINLGYVPFPHMRSRLAGSHWLEVDRPLDIERLIEDINLAEAGPMLEFSDEARTVRFGTGLQVRLGPQQYAVYRFCAEVAVGQLLPNALPTRPGIVMIEDFSSGNHWAARRLKAILDKIDAEIELRYHLESVISWSADKTALWHQATAAELAYKEARQRLGTAQKAFVTAEERFRAARSATTKRMGKTAEQRAKADQNLREARDRRDIADAAQQQAARHFKECEQILKAAKERGSDSLRDQVRAIVKDLQQARKRLDETFDNCIQDFALREQLKLSKGDKPFAMGLKPRLHDPRRIRFNVAEPLDATALEPVRKIPIPEPPPA
jgi:CRISPR-associated protein (TIGR02584 family)